MGAFANRYERALKSFFVLVFLSLCCFFVLHASAQTGEISACTLQIPIEGAITPGTVEFFTRAQEEARKQNCLSLLVTLNTPGGSLASARALNEKILASPIPVLCVVSPAGGHAGSAGALILLACHVSGALPATNIGAATPIAGSGSQLSDDLRAKIVQDTVSGAVSLAKLRNRNLEFAEKIITEARAFDSIEAARIGAIDHVAEDVPHFLDFAGGREVKMDGGQTKIVETGAVVHFEPDFRARVFQVLTDPQIAYLLFMLSLGLLYFELTHPGTVGPGVVGGIGLLVSLVAFQYLDVWWGGVGLIVFGLALLILEAFLPSFGALGIGGIVALGAGSLLLYGPGTPGLPIWMIGLVTILLGSLMLGLAVLAFRTRYLERGKSQHDFRGSVGIVMNLDTPSRRKGMLNVDGEIWKFQSRDDLEVGERVEILNQEQMILIVKNQGS
jgi:membrane-bound serine protease (ClpP class)